jgi:hypothetical protein
VDGVQSPSPVAVCEFTTPFNLAAQNAPQLSILHLFESGSKLVIGDTAGSSNSNIKSHQYLAFENAKGR